MIENLAFGVIYIRSNSQKITRMKFWCLLLALGLVQLSTFMEAVEAAGGRDTDGDGITDDCKLFLMTLEFISLSTIS